ncbi:MAG: EthD domain-containing protein [Spirochaetes bacterium]|nr:EthD domain-containing protein [Spirochaetota bacterium]
MEIKQKCACYKIFFAIPYLKLSKYDGIFEVWFESIASLNEVKNNVEFNSHIQNNNEVFNTSKCSYIVSEEYPAIFENEIGSSPERIKFTTLLIKNSDMNFDEFKNHHKEHHIPLFSSTPIVQKNIKKYVVSHKIEEGNCAKNYNGIVEFWFNNIFSMLVVFMNHEYLSKVRPDEKKFLNLKKCDFIISKEYAG